MILSHTLSRNSFQQPVIHLLVKSDEDVDEVDYEVNRYLVDMDILSYQWVAQTPRDDNGTVTMTYIIH